MTNPQLGWLDRIVDVHWGGGWYVLVQALIADIGGPDILITPLSKTVKKVFEMKKHWVHTNPDTIYHVAWLPTQSMPTAIFNVANEVHIPCWGFFSWWDASTVTIGQPDIAHAFANPTFDNNITGGWWNNPFTRPSSSWSAFSGATQDIINAGGPFASFRAGTFASASEAAAWAAALSGTFPGPGAGGFAIGPPSFVPLGFPSPCATITAPAPTAPLWYPNWITSDFPKHNDPDKFFEYSCLLEVSGTPPEAGEEILRAQFSGGTGGWNTFVRSYKKSGHEVTPQQTGPSPYHLFIGNDPGMVWYPISPYTDKVSETDVDGGTTKIVTMNKKGVVTSV